jgi:hypothetical protein
MKTRLLGTIVVVLIHLVSGGVSQEATPAKSAFAGAEKRKPAPRVKRPQNRPDRLFNLLDSNGNGEISGREMRQAQRVLRRLDRDGDGRLTADELREKGEPGDPTKRNFGRPSQHNLGPWNRDLTIQNFDRNFQLTSSGLFEERGGVPAITQLSDDRLLACFQWFPIDQPQAFDQVAIKVSKDNGRSWDRPIQTQIKNLPERLNRVFDPTPVVLADGRVRLYFSSERGNGFGPRGNRAVFSAISRDGIHYEFEPGQRFGFPDAEAFDVAVVRLEGTWHLFCPIPKSNGSGYHATSKDGLKFIRQDDVTVEADVQWLGNVVNTGGSLRFFGSSRNGIWTATSGDGFHWTLQKTPRMGGGDPGVAVLSNGGFLVIATGRLRDDLIHELPFRKQPVNRKR